MKNSALNRNFFFALLIGVTVAFFWVLAPFFGAILWAVTLALLFHPLNQWLLRRVGGRSTLAALLTLTACLVIVILPIIMIGASIASDVLTFVQKVRGGEINFAQYYHQIIAALPPRVADLLAHFKLFDLQGLMDKVSSGLLQGGQMIATHALQAGQNTFDFLINFAIMLYLLFFLLRDGVKLSRVVRQSIPLKRSHTQFLLGKFATVVRATVKGNVVIAIVQGTLGGVAFWFLGVGGALFWGVVMALLSLLPAIGAALVWAPVAIYLLATHAVGQGIALIIWGVVVIGLSDNLLRPMLVGKDTKLPDYLVLISTVGGMALFGINGFVIGPTIAAMFMACWALFNRGTPHSS
jgi:predicted PurR-regulated permease PerM